MVIVKEKVDWKFIGMIAGVVLVLGSIGAYAGTGYLTGSEFHNQTTVAVQSLNQSLPNLKIVERSHKGGLFRSSTEYKLTANDPAMKGFGYLVQVQASHKPSFKKGKFNLLETVVTLSPEVTAKGPEAAILKQLPKAMIYVRGNADKSAHIKYHIDPFKISLGRNFVSMKKGAQGVASINSFMQPENGWFKIPSFKAKFEKSFVDLANLSINQRTNIINGKANYSSDFGFKSLTVKSKELAMISNKGFSRLQKIGPFNMRVSFNNIDHQSMTEFQKMSQSFNSFAAKTAPAANQESMDMLSQLIANSPGIEFMINSSLVANKARLVANARANLTNVPPTYKFPQMPIQYLNASLNVKMPVKFAKFYFPRQQISMLNNFVKQGFLKKSKKFYAADIKFNKGALLVNGKNMPLFGSR